MPVVLMRGADRGNSANSLYMLMTVRGYNSHNWGEDSGDRGDNKLLDGRELNIKTGWGRIVNTERGTVPVCSPRTPGFMAFNSPAAHRNSGGVLISPVWVGGW